MRVWRVFVLCCASFLPAPLVLVAEELQVDLAVQDAARDWLLLDKSARIENGELVLDGRQKISRAVYLPREWSDVVLTAKFSRRTARRRSSGVWIHRPSRGREQLLLRPF